MDLRLPDWQDRLRAFLDSRRDVPFDWERNDCLRFCGDAFEAMTGVDPIHEYRSAYANQEESEATVEKNGGLLLGVSAKLGESIPWKFAQAGDVVLANMRGKAVLGLCIGENFVGPDTDGLGFCRMADVAVRAWKTGRE